MIRAHVLPVYDSKWIVVDLGVIECNFEFPKRPEYAKAKGNQLKSSRWQILGIYQFRLIRLSEKMTAFVVTLIMFYVTDVAIASRFPLEILGLPQYAGMYAAKGDEEVGPSDSNRSQAQPSSRTSADSAHSQDIKIFYQVGNKEEDLPICAPNAVCSKIDLYETPWIERQCRCPERHIVHKIYHQTSDRTYLSKKNNEILRGSKMKRPNKYISEAKEDLNLKMLLQTLEATYKDDNIDIPEQSKDDHPPDITKNHDLNHSKHGVKLRHNGHHKDLSSTSGCPSNIGTMDGHTIIDKTRHYKLCEPAAKLPICRFFHDYTWTLSILSDMNVTEQIVYCRCPQNSITYLTKREPLASGKSGYVYLFACSPQSRLRCQRKEPCTLFTVRKRQEFLDEVNTNPLCLCPKGHHCPRHHTEPGVISGKNYIEDNIHTYSGYCMTNR